LGCGFKGGDILKDIMGLKIEDSLDRLNITTKNTILTGGGIPIFFRFVLLSSYLDLSSKRKGI
jgi:hypothetical protein